MISETPVVNMASSVHPSTAKTTAASEPKAGNKRKNQKREFDELAKQFAAETETSHNKFVKAIYKLICDKGSQPKTSGYFQYCSENNAQMKEKYPKVQQSERVTMMAEQWNAMDLVKRQPFNERAAKINQEYAAIRKATAAANMAAALDSAEVEADGDTEIFDVVPTADVKANKRSTGAKPRAPRKPKAPQTTAGVAGEAGSTAPGTASGAPSSSSESTIKSPSKRGTKKNKKDSSGAASS